MQQENAQSLTDEDADDDTSAGAVASISAGVVVIFLMLRVLAVSGWEWTTAGRVLDTFNFSDSVSIAMGTLFSEPGLTAMLLAVVTPFAVLRVVWHRTGRVGLEHVALMVVCGVMMISVAFSAHQWWAVGAATAVLVGLVIAGRADPEGRLCGTRPRIPSLIRGTLEA